MLAAQIGDGNAGLMLLQDSDDLLFRKAASLHALVLVLGQNELQTGLSPRGKVNSDELATPFVLVPIIAWLFRSNERPTEASIKRMVRWVYFAQARQRYSVGVLQKLDTELKIIDKGGDPWPQLESLIAEKRPLRITAAELERAALQSPLFTVMRWIFKAREAV